jgi:hypothetical protein
MMGMIGYLIGILLIGLMIFGASLFVEWLVVKHVMDNPANGLIVSILGAFAILTGAYLVGGFFDEAMFVTLPGGLVFALLLALPGYLRRKKALENTENGE